MLTWIISSSVTDSSDGIGVGVAKVCSDVSAGFSVTLGSSVGVAVVFSFPFPPHATMQHIQNTVINNNAFFLITIFSIFVIYAVEKADSFFINGNTNYIYFTLNSNQMK